MKALFRILTFLIISLFAFIWVLIVSLFKDSIQIGVMVSIIVLAVQALVSYTLWGVIDD